MQYLKWLLGKKLKHCHIASPPLSNWNTSMVKSDLLTQQLVFQASTWLVVLHHMYNVLLCFAEWESKIAYFLAADVPDEKKTLDRIVGMRLLSAWMKVTFFFCFTINQAAFLWWSKEEFFQVLAKLLFCHDEFPNRYKTNFTNLFLLFFPAIFFRQFGFALFPDENQSVLNSFILSLFFLMFLIFFFFLLVFLGQWIPGEPLGHDLQWECILFPLGQPGLYTRDPGGPRVQRHHRAALRGDHQRHPLQKPGCQQATQ